MKPTDKDATAQGQSKVRIEVPVDAIPVLEEAFGAVPVKDLLDDGATAEAEIVVTPEEAAALTKLVHEEDGVVQDAEQAT